MNLSDTFCFGKFKGCTLQSVIGYQPHYVRWCLREVRGFSISSQASTRLENAKSWRDSQVRKQRENNEKIKVRYTCTANFIPVYVLVK